MLNSILLLLLAASSLLGHPTSSWSSEIVIQVHESQDAIIEDVSASKSSSAIQLATNAKIKPK